jgi:ubiquinone/menaquinone biosynthesis C-methylase UbiE
VNETITYDEEPARRIEALSATADMRDQRRRVIALLAPEAGWSVLDVGCGPAHLTRELAAAVGGRGRTVGVDVSEQMLALAQPGAAELVLVGDTRLPFDDASFDGAVSTQAYEFVQQLPAALAELHRVLRAGARAVILDTDWSALVWHSSDGERMDRVLDGWRRRVADPHLPRTLGRQLRDAGFQVTHREAYAILDTDGDPDSYSAHQIEHLGASASGVAAEEIEAWAADLRELAASGDYFFSLNRYVFVATKPGAGPRR